MHTHIVLGFRVCFQLLGGSGFSLGFRVQVYGFRLRVPGISRALAFHQGLGFTVQVGGLGLSLRVPGRSKALAFHQDGCSLTVDCRYTYICNILQEHVGNIPAGWMLVDCGLTNLLKSQCPSTYPINITIYSTLRIGASHTVVYGLGFSFKYF